LDMNAYLEKMYLTVFHQRKRVFVGPARARVERRVLAAYRVLMDIVAEWARTEAKPAQVDRVDMSGTPQREYMTVRQLKDFIGTHAERVPPSGESAEAHRQLADRLPATADFQIADTKLFSEALEARLRDYVEGTEISERLGERVEKALREQSLRAWSLIRGCSERCPLCGSKCDLVGEHSHHQCAHHLFPAFHGWMDRNTGLPSFNHCLGQATRLGTYECKDGTWRSLEEYLQADYPAWLPFVHTDKESNPDEPYLRAAWCNCREPLLEYFAPMAGDCPAEWSYNDLVEPRALAREELDRAKVTIRKLRNHTWAPPEDT